MTRIKVTLKSGKEVAVQRFHPWVFSGAIASIQGKSQDGDLAEVYDRSGQRLAIGHFHHGSIAVRILGFYDEDPTLPDFWTQALARALAARARTGLLEHPDQTNAYRLVHGEGDGLSGLVVDVYGPTAVVQCHSIGMHRQRSLIARGLMEAMEGRISGVYDKSVESLPGNYAAGQQNGWLIAPAGHAENTAVVRENGVLFRVDWETGQKTGFFLDQRDNRALLARYAPGKSVLNTFCYTGGFSAYALHAGAHTVHSVDISGKAMELTAQNVELNRPFGGVHAGFTEDVLPFFKKSNEYWDIVVVDPPAYAKTIEKRHNAVQGYRRLNAAAIERVKPGGLLFTFSCSQVVDRQLFYNTIVAAALEAGRPARVLHHLTQGPDHPVSLFHPEGAYLKGLVVYLE
jgi:23S rRNA (cytosine1962-C5)-methyltransferase